MGTEPNCIGRGLCLCLWPVCHFLYITMEPIFLGQFFGSEGLLGLGQCERTVTVCSHCTE